MGRITSQELSPALQQTIQDLYTRLANLKVFMYDEYFESTAGQTVFTVNTPYEVGMSLVEVFVGGVRQMVGKNFLESSPITITLTEPISKAGIPVIIKIFTPNIPVAIPGGGSGETNQEVIDARTSSKNIEFSSLKERLDLFDATTFTTVYQLKTDLLLGTLLTEEKIPSPFTVKTLGYHEAGDGGGAVYRVQKDTLVADDGFVIALTNGYQALLIS